MNRFVWLAAALIACSACSPSLRAAIVLPTTNVSDGALNPSAANTVIALSQAVAAAWDATSPSPGSGVYDASKWAVVFKYSSVNIASGRTVTFTNHASRAPVVWLVNGDVTINGTLSLNGEAGSNTIIAEPGPGGFRGGINVVSATLPAGPGLGPGGGGVPEPLSPSGSYATLGQLAEAGATYGHAQVVPLLGGSGGSGSSSHLYSGGAGGGALLIAATGAITINGTVTANGGNAIQGGAGSGGAIRLVADTVTGAGTLRAVGGTGNSDGGDGRIRIEANTVGAGLSTLPATSASTPGNPALIWPPDTGPSVRVVSIAGRTAPADPRASLGPVPADVLLDSAAPVTVTLETRNVTTTARVTVRVAPKHGNPIKATAIFASGNEALATWTAQISLPQGSSAIQARVDPS